MFKVKSRQCTLDIIPEKEYDHLCNHNSQLRMEWKVGKKTASMNSVFIKRKMKLSTDPSFSRAVCFCTIVPQKGLSYFLAREAFLPTAQV